MTLLPIVSRELLVRARQPGTHRLRWMAAGVALLMALPTLLGNYPTPAMMGRQLFSWLVGLAMAYCLLEGARQTADCLSGEKRDGTLGLLFLTPMKGFDVVLGKLVAASLNSIYTLLAIIPVLALPLLAGGVTGGEFARVMLVLANTMFFGLAIGMRVSSRNQDEMRALFTAMLLAVFSAVAPVAADLLQNMGPFTPRTIRWSLASPLGTLFLSWDRNFRGFGGWFWFSLALVHGSGWCLLLLAASKANRLAVQESPQDSVRQQARTHVEKGWRRRRCALERNPVGWLAARQRGAWMWVCLAVAAMVALPVATNLVPALFGWRVPMMGWGMITYSHLLVYFGVRFLIAYLACRFFNEARRTGTLELLLCIPLGRGAILRGQSAALWRVLLWPLLVGVCLQVVVGFWPVWESAMRYRLPVFSIVTQAAMLGADTLALATFGPWAALTAKRPAAAVAKTFFVAAFLPWILLKGMPVLMGGGQGIGLGNALNRFYGPLSPFLPLLIDLGIAWWAGAKLRRAFWGDASQRLEETLS